MQSSPTSDDHSYQQSAAVVVKGLWTSIIVVGALGNGLVIYTMGRHGERSATNCYIINLAVSDFAVLTVVVPFTMAMFTSYDWLYGVVMCKVTVYLIYVMLQATCLTLTAMTIDRYFAIVHPISSLRDRTPRTAILISISTWIASSLVCIPFLVYSQLLYQLEPSGLHVYCVSLWPSDTWTKAITVAFIMSTYVLPLFVIVVCYTLILKHLGSRKVSFRREAGAGVGCVEAEISEGPVIRRRRRVAKTVFAIVLLFAVTWLPIHVFNLCYVLIDPFPKTAFLYSVKIMCHTLSYLNSCLNPFVYGFFGDGFRQAFRKSFPRCSGRNQVAPSVHDTTNVPSTMETRLAAGPRAEAGHDVVVSSSVPHLEE
ncbi:G-protein coupled receptor 54-like isoform X1 [Pomacea canaliculata]|uniref:G-protein coupled receptor 54-like isoform X1 n=1 Tax=Pomacea canaliculata TaxID=400727 RepID=UPI000D73EE87|nr:G-protein coupled receptor 54-like isoform X1 [Pomacea canaliculata]